MPVFVFTSNGWDWDFELVSGDVFCARYSIEEFNVWRLSLGYKKIEGVKYFLNREMFKRCLEAQ